MTRSFPYVFSSAEEWEFLTNGIIDTFHKNIFSDIGMRFHFIGGAIILVLNNIQLLPVLHQISLHTFCGTLYCYCAVITSTGGIIHIFTAGTSGGKSMDVAFLVYGICFGLTAAVTFVYAKIKNIQQHRVWALRAWSLGNAPLLYRIIYLILLPFFPIGRKGFAHTLDKIINYVFFLTPLFLMEIYINTSKIKSANTFPIYS